ncbi:MAG: transposase [Limisphaerales bacterium]
MACFSAVTSERYTADELARVYLRRWSVETFYRDIKQTNAMDILRCQSAAMINKEIHLHVIAYKLIRALMNDIAQSHQVDVQRISLKGTVDTLRQWSPFWDQPRGHKHADRDSLYEIIAQDLLLIRPHRSEPRVLKRRPKNSRLITKPRHQMVVEKCRKQS